MSIVLFILVYIVLQLSTRYNRSKKYNSISLKSNSVLSSSKKEESDAIEIKNMILLTASDEVDFELPKCRILADLLSHLQQYEDTGDFLNRNPHILEIIFKN